MKICLVFPPFHDPKPTMPPLGLLRLGTQLQLHNYDVQIIDFLLLLKQKQIPQDKRIYRRAAEMIMDTSPDVVGFSTQCVTYPPSLNIAALCKEINPACTIIFGGHNASFVDVETLENFPYVDIVVRGEGEQTIVELMAALSTGHSLEKVEGITFRGENEIIVNKDRRHLKNLDDLPLPDYRLIAPLSEYREANRMRYTTTLIDIGRGCSFNCIFCSNCLLWGKSPHVRSIENITRELHYLKYEQQVERIYITYDLFTFNRKIVEEFCAAVKPLGLLWECRCRVDGVNGQLLRLMADAGCTSLLYGIESGSPKTLDFIRKGITISKALDIVALTAEAGIEQNVSFVTGFPGETMEDLDMTLDAVTRCALFPETVPGIHHVTVLPGTDLYRQNKNNLVLGIPTDFSKGIEFDDGKRLAEDDELIVNYPQVFASFYNLKSEFLSQELLHDISQNFIKLACRFPASFRVMRKELGLSPLTLFRRWRDYYDENRNLHVYDAFRQFARLSLAAAADKREEKGKKGDRPLTYPYLEDLIRFEYIRTKLASENENPWEKRDDDVVTVDILPGSVPRLSEKTVVETFAYDINEILGALRKDETVAFSPRPIDCAFSIKGQAVLTTKLSRFGAQFILLCDGERTYEEIVVLLGRQLSRSGSVDESTVVAACVNGINYFISRGIITLLSVSSQ